MDSSLTGSACGCLYFPCHEHTETDFEMMTGPFLRASCGCRLYCCVDPGRNRDLSVAAQAAGHTTSITNGDYDFQEQLFGGGAPNFNNLPMTVLPGPNANTRNNGGPAQALAAQPETSNRLPDDGYPLDWNNLPFRHSPPLLNRPPYSEAAPGLNRLTTPADTSSHPMVFSNANDVRPQDPVAAMYDPFEWPRLFSSTPPLNSNSILDSDNLGLSYNGYSAPGFRLPDPPRTCPECGSRREGYDACSNHRVPHNRELALFHGTEGTYTTNPARRLGRVPDHYPLYMDLSGLDSGHVNAGSMETDAGKNVNVTGQYRQSVYDQDLHQPLSTDWENYIRGGQAGLPGTARSPLPSLSAAVEQSRRPLVDSGPLTPGSPRQQSRIGSVGDHRDETLPNIGEDNEDSHTTIGQSRHNNQAENTGPPRNDWHEGRPNGRPQFGAQDGLLRHPSQQTSAAGQSISSGSCGYWNSSYSSIPTGCSICPGLDSSIPSPPPASGISSRSGYSRCGCCNNTERRSRPRDDDMQRVGRRSTGSDISSAESPATTSTIGSTGSTSSSMDSQWERPAYHHRQRYSIPLRRHVDFLSHRPRVLFRQPPGYPSTLPGPWERQQEPARRPVLLGPSQTRAHRHSRGTISPYHQIVPTLWLMLGGLLATAVELGLYFYFVGGSGSGRGR